MIGKKIKVNDIDFLVLDEDDNNNLFVIALDLDITTKFDHSTNDYRNSVLRQVTEKWCKNSKVIISKSRTIDLMAMNGSKDYGKLNVVVAPLTFDEYRKYSSIIIPEIKDWFWLITPWETQFTNFACVVLSDGKPGYSSYRHSRYFAPALWINKSSIKNNPLANFTTADLLAEIERRTK